MSDKFASHVIRGFGKLFRTFGGAQAPTTLDLAGAQPVIELAELARYGSSPGLDDGWWLGRFDLQLNGIGYQSGTWDPRITAGSPVTLRPDLIPWVYGVSMQIQAIADIADFSRSRVRMTGYANTLGSGAAIATPLAFFTSGSVYKSSALVGEAINEMHLRFNPVRVPDAGLLEFVVQNDGAVGNVQYAYAVLLRFLPPGVMAT